ncbi:MAG: hypothetical protein RMJ55_02185 [Roseiflexaceae bacterium]|nr:hypothetical protein [Roseiflexaceae bacterium]
MEFEQIFRYPLIRPAPEVAVYGCKARLRGLHWAISDYFLKLQMSAWIDSLTLTLNP